MSVHLAPELDPEMASLQLGNALASVLTLSGSCVLHASAVELGGQAIVFVGASGMGKSTIAAVGCAAGAKLVSDDVLRVEVEDDAGWCHRGSVSLRLRPQAMEVADLLPGDGTRSTIDQRLALHPPPSAHERLPIAAIVVPLCALGTAEFRVDRLRGMQAARELLRYPRTIGWADGEVARRDLAVLAQIAQLVPVCQATLPWGPPFRPALAEQLFNAVL